MYIYVCSYILAVYNIIIHNMCNAAHSIVEYYAEQPSISTYK